MAYSKVSNDGRLNLHKDFCVFAGINYGATCYIINLSADEKSFDVVNDPKCHEIFAVVRPDRKCRICLPKFMRFAKPGTYFSVTYQKGVIHFRQYDNPLDLYRDTKKGVG